MTQKIDLTENTDEGARAHCGNCDWRGPVSALAAIADPGQRLSPGDECPAGECPKCGALAYLDDDQAEPSAMEEARARGYEDGFADGHSEGVELLLHPARKALEFLEEGPEPMPGAAAMELRDAIVAAEEFNPDAKPAPALAAILADMLAFPLADDFHELDTSSMLSEGGDMVDAFIEWRGQIREALAARSVAGTEAAPGMVTIPREAADALLQAADAYTEDLASGLADGTYDEDPGCEAIERAADTVRAIYETPRQPLDAAGVEGVEAIENDLEFSDTFRTWFVGEFNNEPIPVLLIGGEIATDLLSLYAAAANEAGA